MSKINKGERNKRGSGARMKKEYVKPVIESEEFVANEYVAACWNVHCTLHNGNFLSCGQEDWSIKGYDSIEAYIKDNPDRHPYIHNDMDTNYEESGKYYHIGSLNLHHELLITPYKEYNPKHPNASV